MLRVRLGNLCSLGKPLRDAGLAAEDVTRHFALLWTFMFERLSPQPHPGGRWGETPRARAGEWFPGEGKRGYAWQLETRGLGCLEGILARPHPMPLDAHADTYCWQI